MGTALLVAALAAAACTTAPSRGPDNRLFERDCDAAGDLFSRAGEDEFEVEFLNAREERVELFWVNYDGEEERVRTLRPGETWPVTTYATHPWMVRDLSGECLRVYDSRASLRVVIE